MAVGLEVPNSVLPVTGIKLSTVATGMRYKDRDDLVLVTKGANTTAVFTQSHYCAAPVTLAKTNLADNSPRALLINSGNANAATGELGMQNAELSCSVTAQEIQVDANQVLPFSTGVIGEQMAMDVMQGGIEALSSGLDENNWLPAARAIMTTDTVPKAVSEQVELDGHTVTISGMAKGSGMICPNMATMLAYVATDATIEQSVLDEMLHNANAASFNRITVDSDTSTNDALVLIASGKSVAPTIDSIDSASASLFYQALEKVMIQLATSIVRDAEGATKFVKVAVSGGASQADCASIAYSVAHSPLVKTALFASDPNWGRILMAVGKAQVEHIDLEQIAIQINDVALIERGQPAESYTETAGKAVFSQEEITISIDLNLGNEQHHVWTSDLSHDYVSINADYRS